jgi:hypothetical protein
MPEDYYSDGGDAPSSKAGEAPETGAGDADQPTGILPKAILAGKKFNVGDEVMLKIVAIHGDEVQVAYAPEKEEPSEAPAPGEEPEPAAAPSGMSSMME